MIGDTHIKELYDFIDAGDCFPGVDISGGICYFLWDRHYQGPCKVINVENETEHSEKRYLNQYPILIRSNKAVPIINKVLSGSPKTLDKKVSSQKPFGLRTFVRPDEFGDLVLRWNGGKGPVKREKVSAGYHLIDKWNVIVSRVSYVKDFELLVSLGVFNDSLMNDAVYGRRVSFDGRPLYRPQRRCGYDP